MNITEEQWIPWNLFDIKEAHYRLDSIAHTKLGVEIFLSLQKEENKHFLIQFSSIHAYRTTYETHRYRVLVELSEKYGQSFYTACSFFKVHNSKYLRWLSQQSEDNSSILNSTHYVIFSLDYLVDITSSEEPNFHVIASTPIFQKE